MEKTIEVGDRGPGDAERVSLRGLYLITAAATVLGILVVGLLNMFTPVEFMMGRLAHVMGGSFSHTALQMGVALAALLGLLVIGCGLDVVAMERLLRPVSMCLRLYRSGRAPHRELMAKARRRLLNLPFLFIPANLALWVLLPACAFFGAHFLGFMDLRTSVVFSIRASMVGFISTAIAFFGIEAETRKELIPFFFPEGRLAELDGVARIPISRRIRMLFRLGSLVPMFILVVTLFTLQWEVDSATITAEDYGRGILVFTLVLTGLFFFTSGQLNRMVARSITDPIQNILRTVGRVRGGDFDARIQVVGNDEIGVLSDAANELTRGLGEREMMRNAFGRYVTPEIRDEILSGRIPLEGERREATVMFADLRHFTPFVENNRPEDVIAGMRAYFTAMDRAIRKNRGLVLQFVGDGIEAVFGVPVPFDDHADAALSAALDMRRALEDLNRDRTEKGLHTFSHGIGIHSGEVLAGNTGSEEQSAYALIGSTVNVASRLEGLTRDLECDILASQETVERLTRPCPMEQEAPRMVKGYSRPIIVYRIS
jgi:adenylate cyclase